MVIILIVAAVILGVVVLYNLGIMSYVERSRELATLKVLGFRNRTIGKLLISQNIWLTVIGVLIGLPAGVGVLQWLLAALAGEYEMKLMLGALTYSVSILLTFGVSLLVGLMVAGKNKKIDMVEALKGTEYRGRCLFENSKETSSFYTDFRAACQHTHNKIKK